jgi:SPP1 gp7 family putative phage head morphogenesis protein
VIRFPIHLERQYASRLVRRLRTARAILTDRLADSLAASRTDNEQEREAERLAAILAARQLQVTIAATQRAFLVAMPASPESLLPLAAAADAFTTRAVTREVSRLVAVDVEADNRIGSRSRAQMRELHQTWARANVELVTTMEREAFEDLAAAVVEAVAEGRTDLAAVLAQRFGVAENRARLIARDQIGSLNAQITEARQTQLGIESYEWSTSGDERVRPAHRKLDGTIRRWDDPHPTERHPGHAIQCRCVAIPVVVG